MPLLVAACLLAVSAVFAVVRRKKEYVLLCALAASLVVYLWFMLTYIAKKGGIAEPLSTVLFVTAGFRHRLQYSILTLQQLGYGVAVGRFLFPFLFLLTALEYSSSPRTFWLRRHGWLLAFLPAAALVLYFPPVFLRFADHAAPQKVAVYGSLAWIAAYLLAGCVLLIREPARTRIRYIRNSMVVRCVLLCSIAALYAIYCPQDPAQVYLFYRGDYMFSLGIWYLTPYLSPGTYLVIVIINMVSLLLGTLSMVGMARIEWSETQDDISLQRKYDTVRMGGGVFLHGIKNQLLANRVLGRRLDAELSAPAPDLEKARALARQMTDTNEGLLEHVGELYKSLKSNAISMRECPVEHLVQGAVRALNKKYPAACVDTDLPPGLVVLADESHMEAVLANLLINGWEATVAAGRDTPLRLTCYEKPTQIGICVQDGGVGIGKYELKKIFEPFYSSKNSNSNWGMGLYYVRTIVKKHMGSLRVDSDYGKGTSFYILLPKLLPERVKRGKAPV
ncbi:MAG TPA: HAMP domain-containing histidine kinase [Candidatus Gemmiger avistercoris]|uniref:histidine kinase n=1 Tax=Candidatus Gemmiger avistercoris TaxID=2838606 RepID=A0A9D2FL84_9FIRM|nr:HAMP domain-containing sensor histidine kinase [uncultured Subdoligranulum sp.]HIZ62561.1 HAMP domain-containing histidine kinase [Candidatus Gemmiger avistercoris]